jgi:hypothetical protein
MPEEHQTQVDEVSHVSGVLIAEIRRAELDGLQMGA